MTFRSALLFTTLSALSFAAAAPAQQPAPSDAVANPGRPTVSTPATLTPVGYLQFESGFMDAWRSPEFTFQLNSSETVKLAVSSRLQLLAVTEPAARSKTPAQPPVQLDSQLDSQLATQPGGIALGGQAIFHAGHGPNPTLAASYLRQVYGGTAPDLDLGSPIDALTFLASADVRGFHYDTNYLFNRMVQNGVQRPQFGQTLSISRQFNPRFSLSGELWHFTQPFLHGRAVGNLWAIGYTQRPNLVWDAGFNRGLTSTSTQWETFAGFTYLLPHRLWPRPR